MLFPQILAAVALFILFTDLGEIVPVIGLNTLAGYMLVLCGFALGQVWLIKGFFDSIPRSLDEAAVMDGAGHATIFFRIILPLITPILAVSGPAGVHRRDREFLLASIFLRDTNVKTLAVGPLRDHRRRPVEQPRAVRGRLAAHGDPGGPAVPVPAEVHRRRADRRRGQGLTRAAGTSHLLHAPHHDGSVLCVPSRRHGWGSGSSSGCSSRTTRAGRPAPTPSRCGSCGTASRSGRPSSRSQARRDVPAGVWWRAELTAVNPVTRYRFLLTGPPGSTVGRYSWLTGTGCTCGT
jgi:hypothetical protein